MYESRHTYMQIHINWLAHIHTHICNDASHNITTPQLQLMVRRTTITAVILLFCYGLGMLRARAWGEVLALHRRRKRSTFPHTQCIRKPITHATHLSIGRWTIIRRVTSHKTAQVRSDGYVFVPLHTPHHKRKNQPTYQPPAWPITQRIVSHRSNPSRRLVVCRLREISAITR